MGETVSARLDQHQIDALEAMTEAGESDNPSEALRTVLDVGLSELGYENGHRKQTRLRATVQRFADAFALLGLIWVGLTFLYPLGFRMFAIPIFVMALGLHGADRALAAYEPAVSARLFGWFGGEAA